MLGFRSGPAGSPSHSADEDNPHFRCSAPKATRRVVRGVGSGDRLQCQSPTGCVSLEQWVTFSEHQMLHLSFINEPLASMQGKEEADTDEATESN